MRGSATPSTPLARAEQRHEPGLEPALEPGKHGRPAVARSGVLIAYSHRDRDLLGELQVHLKPLQKAWMLDLWDDLRLDPGPRGATELQRAVEATRVAVLLVSPAFLSSTFVAGHALPALLAGQVHPRAAVMCVYLRPALDVFAEPRSCGRPGTRSCRPPPRRSSRPRIAVRPSSRSERSGVRAWARLAERAASVLSSGLR